MGLEELCQSLDGMFSFVLLDESVTPPRIIAARDPIGITTLYQGWSSSDPSRVYFASELKAIADECDKIIPFPPGHVYDSASGKTTRYFKPSWWDGDGDESEGAVGEADLTKLRETLEDAVRKRLMSEVPYGVLLSGGLDSSLIAAIATRETEKVAQAQMELRKKRLETSESSTPSGDVTERGMIPDPRLTVLSALNNIYDPLPIGLASYPGCLASASFIQYRSPQLS